jgi:hypothetical protein
VRLIVHNYLPASRTSDTGAGRQFVHAWQQARKFDALKYLDGLAKLTFTDDVDQWNAGYSAALDEISVERKFMKKSLFDMIQTLLHEAGHRGQKFDPQTFKAMANDVHQKDYREHGIKSDVMRDEVFAESYSRFALGMKMPDALYKFWTERARAS